MAKKKSNGNGNGNGEDKKSGGMTWMSALKAWNKKKGGKYQIPKKGSSGYNEVKSMMK